MELEQKKKPSVSSKRNKKANSQTENLQTNINTNTQKKQDTKSRIWWCLVYPESAIENWQQKLQECFLETYISPLHDKDINADGSIKKAHYHVVLCWEGPTTYKNAKNIIESFGGVIQPKPVGSIRGVCRYLCHLDNPEKAQYQINDVICYNGADYTVSINLKSDKYTAIEEMQDFCSKYKICSFVKLNTYARHYRKDDWFRCLCDNGGFIMREYCKSLQWELENNNNSLNDCYIEEIVKYIKNIDDEIEFNKTHDIDIETGEIKPKEE